ncbi:MAG TPA: hypothetical protein VIJ04_06405 [Xanthobacteraceae bacterium]
MEFDQHLVGHEPAFTGWRNATGAATDATATASASASTSVTAQAQRTNPASNPATNTVTDNPTMRKIPDAPAAVTVAATSRQVSASASIRNAARSMFASAVPPAERVPLHARAHACTAEMSAHPEKCARLLRTANPAYAGQRHRQCQDESRSQCDSHAPHCRASQSNQTAPQHAQKTRPVKPNSSE